MVKKSGRTNASRSQDSNSLTPLQRVRSWLRAAKNYLDSPGILPWLLNIALAFLIIKFIVFPGLSLIFGSALPVVAVMSGSMEHGANDGTICGRVVSESYRGSLDDFWNECGGWYEQRGISFETFSSFPLKRGFNKGDIMVIFGPERGTIEVGDTIVFHSREPYPIIHRVVAVEGTGGVGVDETRVYQTKGDHNPAQIVTYIVVNAQGLMSACHYDGVPVRCLDGVPVTRETPGAIAILDETAIAHEDVIGRAVLRIPWLGWVKIWFSDALAALLR